MQLFVKVLNGKTVTLEVEPDDTVASVKQQVMDKEGIEPATQRLIFSGQMLTDDTTLARLSLSDATTLHLVIRVPANES